jgi:26S proteasome regulatory subunit N3
MKDRFRIITSPPSPLTEIILYHLLTSEDTHEKAQELANETVEKMQALNRRSMDALAAKVWFAVDQACELAGDLSDARP